MEKALGPEHPHVATRLENYAAPLPKTRRSAFATEMKARAKATSTKHTKENAVKLRAVPGFPPPWTGVRMEELALMVGTER